MGGDSIAEEAVYKLKVDTSEGQASVDKLDEGIEKLSEKLDRSGAAGKNAGDGIASGAGKGMGMLDKLGQNLDYTGNAMDSLGMSFAKNFSKASDSGKSFSTSIKTGIVGALDTATKKVTNFARDGTNNVKKFGNAFLHPIQTIKGRFTGAMKDAADDTEKVGDEAKKSGNKLDDMGKSGAGAGDKLKNGLGAALKVIGALAAAAVLVTGIAKFTSAALNASQAAENISYSFDKTFGDAAPDVEAWANNFSSAIHRSESEVKSFLSTNKQFFEGLGITGQAARDLSKITTSLAYDIGNKFGIDDAEALSGLQDAISGNADALSAYGVKLDKATLAQTALNMGIKSNLDDMDEATLAQIRMNAILEQTGDIQQSATKSIGGFTGGVKALKAGWTDFLEKAGSKLAPTFDKIFGVILDAWPKVEPALMMLVDMLANGFEQAVPVILEFATTLLPQLLGLLGSLAPILMEIGGQLLPVLSQVFTAVVDSIGPLMPLVGTLINVLLPPLTQIFGTLVKSLLPPLATLLGALAPVIDALSPILTVVSAGIGLVADAIAGLIGWLTKGIEKVGEFAQGLKNSGVGQFVGGIGDGLSSAAGSVKSFFASNAQGTDNFEGGWTRINEAGGELIHAKHDGGIAYLPQGSAVIPASKTDEILSDSKNGTSPNPNWTPVVVEGNPNINNDGPTGDGTPKNDGGNDDGTTPPPPTPPPAPASGGAVIRKVIDLNVTVSSPDGTVSQEVREQIKREILEAVREERDDELNSLAIQGGFAG